LRLVKSDTTKSEVTRHSMQFPIIIDSGANFHTFKDREFFSNITPATGKVILGDGKTIIPIQGIGTVECTIGSHRLQIKDVKFLPSLSESIYSLFSHTQLPHHGVYSSFQEDLFLQFPEFRTKAIGQNDVYLDAYPDNFSPSLESHPFVDEQSRATC
jgi:hypothetical protein